MQILITGRGLELTDAIEDYVTKKVGALEKFFDGIIRAEVIVGEETHHHVKGEVFFAECKLAIPGHELFAKQTAKDLYAAVDLLKDQLEGELKKQKEKMSHHDKKQKISGRENKEYQAEE